MADDGRYPKTLFAAVFAGGIPLLMGAAVFYFTSGVVLSCAGSADGRASCAEGRRILGLIDVPLRRYPVVLGAAYDTRQATDEDGDSYTTSVPVLLTPAGREDLAPFGSGADLAGAVEQVDAFAKKPVPGGLTVGAQAGGVSFAGHIFGLLFIVLGVGNFVGYAKNRIAGIS
jgi:hypothetical protein